MRNVGLLVGYQAIWWSAILGAGAGRPWIGVVVAAALIPAWWMLSGQFGAEALLSAAAAGLGWTLDALASATGALGFPEAARLGEPAPLWMVAMWVGFAALLSGPLAWLNRRPAVAALCGAAGGPLAYEAGSCLGAVELGPNAWLVIAAEWAVATPVLGWIAGRGGAR